MSARTEEILDIIARLDDEQLFAFRDECALTLRSFADDARNGNPPAFYLELADEMATADAEKVRATLRTIVEQWGDR